MGKKKRSHPDVEEILGRPWCYYCERDFEDLKLLISHQKAKHFKCDRCGRRLNTAGGLSVHLNQVHKESLESVENALPNRQGLDVEIFGMEGIPQEALEQHRNRIIQTYYQAQEDRRIATGNPLPGQGGQGHARKKVKIESEDALLQRLSKFREDKKNGIVSANGETATTANPNAPQFDGQPPYGYTGDSLPARPTGGVSGANLPQRPSQDGAWNGHDGQQPAAAQGDDIDQLIRMAEAGIRPPQKPEDGDEGGEKKSKKDKKGKMFYDDAEFSPEERMAALPRYAFTPVAAA